MSDKDLYAIEIAEKNEKLRDMFEKDIQKYLDMIVEATENISKAVKHYESECNINLKEDAKDFISESVRL